MFVIKLRTIISYLAIAAVLVASFGIVKLTSDTSVPSISENAVDTVCVPIIMYHNILKSNSRSSKFIVTQNQFKEDLEYLKNAGYNTIVMEDLVNYVYNDTPLPEKPIVLTFDDGYYNNYVYAYPMLKEYGFKGVLSVIGYYTDLYSENGEKNENYSHVTWENIKEMASSGVIELQNHSYNLHSTDKGRNGSKKKKGESKEEYKKVLTDDLSKLQKDFSEKAELNPTTYTYPFGSVSEASYDIIKEMGFKCSLSCESGINNVSKDENCLYMMKRCIRTPGISVEKILTNNKLQ